jgi:hypothetical protein
MNVTPNDDARQTPSAGIEARLRALAGLQPPAALRDRLRADVPEGPTGPVPGLPTPRAPQIAQYIGIAAAFILVASALFRFATPSGRSPGPVADINDRSMLAATTDHNGLRPPDSNVCDSNAIP